MNHDNARKLVCGSLLLVLVAFTVGIVCTIVLNAILEVSQCTGQ